jgi:hypothetical protein
VTKCIAEFGLFHLIFDCVSSGEERDKSEGYEERLSGLVKKDGGTYVCINGGTGQWLLAHFKKFMGIDLFPRGRALFWFSFPS